LSLQTDNTASLQQLFTLYRTEQNRTSFNEEASDSNECQAQGYDDDNADDQSV